MRLRLQLFGKIFIGFWLAMVAVLASWLVSSQYFDTNPVRGVIEHRPKGPPQRFVLNMIYELQNLEQSAIPGLIDRASTEHDVDIYLLDRVGKDFLAREVPATVLQLAQRLQGARRRAYETGNGQHMLAHELYRPDRGVLRAVFVFRPPRHLLLGLLGSSLWLRAGLAVLVSGLVCYLLSRLMTRRIGQLQVASRRLATGDLDTRLQVRRQGGDETDELARGFNSMAQQLQERIQAQKRLLGDVSHELRSPLARLRVALALAEKKPEKTPDYLQRIEREVSRLEELIGQLLASQPSEGELDSHIALLPLLEQLCSDANFEGNAQGKRVVFRPAVRDATVASAGDLLHKCFENILRNALRHTRENSEIAVHLDQVGDTARVSITDCGGGVPAAELDRIFEAFYRTDTTRTRDTGGHGLGLAIARRAVLRHGGEIQARNTGSGLAVTITLPLLS